jgi:hypothetical protein
LVTSTVSDAVVMTLIVAEFPAAMASSARSSEGYPRKKHTLANSDEETRTLPAIHWIVEDLIACNVT